MVLVQFVSLLHTFLKFLIIKKTTQKEENNSQCPLINHFEMFQGRLNKIPLDFGFDLDRLAHAGIIFAPVRNSLRNGKKLPHVSRRF